MTSTSDTLAAAPEILAIGGKSFLIAKSAHMNLVSVRAAMKKKLPTPMQMLGKVQEDPVWNTFPPEVQHELMREAARSQMKGELPLSDDMVFDMIATDKELVALMAWTQIRIADPSVKLQDVQAVVTDENSSEVVDNILRLSGLPDVEKNSAGLNGSQTRVMEAPK